MTRQLDASDQRILEITKDLYQKLDISSINPDWVTWSGYAPRGSILTGRLMTVPYDGCTFDDNTIVLAEGFRNELEPEDWGPLIASELIFRERLQGRLPRSLLPRLMIPTILSLLTGILLWLSGILSLGGTITTKGSPIPLVSVFFTVYTLASVFLVIPAYIFLGLPLSKSLRLIADREAVRVTGKERFLNALTKVGERVPKLMIGKRPDSRYPFGRPVSRDALTQSRSATLNDNSLLRRTTPHESITIHLPGIEPPILSTANRLSPARSRTLLPTPQQHPCKDAGGETWTPRRNRRSLPTPRPISAQPRENATLEDVHTQLASLADLQELEMLDRKVASLPTWPFDIQVVSKFVTIVLSVTAVLLSRLTTGFLHI